MLIFFIFIFILLCNHITNQLSGVTDDFHRNICEPNKDDRVSKLTKVNYRTTEKEGYCDIFMPSNQMLIFYTAAATISSWLNLKAARNKIIRANAYKFT